MGPGEAAGAAAVLFAAYFVRALAGFGSGLIAVPLLAHFQPLTLVVPVVMALDFAASFLIGRVGGSRTDWSEIRILLPFGLMGALFGAWALVRFPSRPILLALGLFTLVFGLRNLLGVQASGRISRLWAIPAGLIGSSAGALFGTSAPPYVVYLTHRLDDKTAVRATFSWLFVIDGGARLLLLAAAGLFAAADTRIALALGLLPMLAGLYLGNRVHLGISRDRMLRAIGLILVASAASLLSRVFA
ncbi:MAG: sulfite exporter TauE/SafE family protein [Rhodocyclaceae bacterium]